MSSNVQFSRYIYVLILLGTMDYIATITNVVGDLIKYERIDKKMEKLKRKFERVQSREEDVKEELKYAERLSLEKTKETS